MNSGKVWFCSYGNNRFKNSIIRIAKEAIEFGFDEIKTYTTLDLPDEMLKDPVMKCQRGGGYYIWKPYIIEQTLKLMNDGDLLFYLDSGCSIKNNAKAKETYKEYIRCLIEEIPILTCLTAKTPRIAGYKRFIEYQWTKMDLFDYLNAHKFKDEIQICSGFIGIRKCEESLSFIEKWKNIMRVQGCHMAKDSPSIKPNYPGFVEHRHDQSVLSLLVRIHGYKPLEDQILTYDKDPDSHPFWATRLRV